ncbi:hypothetical protein Tco_0560014 [Tanacetum coccineum]
MKKQCCWHRYTVHLCVLESDITILGRYRIHSTRENFIAEFSEEENKLERLLKLKLKIISSQESSTHKWFPKASLSTSLTTAPELPPTQGLMNSRQECDIVTTARRRTLLVNVKKPNRRWTPYFKDKSFTEEAKEKGFVLAAEAEAIPR